ncbi:hypothetical protein TNCV_1788681 [Trichonephila clavipes]|nr:hypothetical protein TNCV_1788681 [Trichonephila clavipes]
MATFILSLPEFLRAKSYCHLYGAQGWPTTGVSLAHCHDEFRGSRSDPVRKVALAMTTRDLQDLLLFLLSSMTALLLHV